MQRYLFIRILEACNADCFMCGFAKSTDRHRFGTDDFETLLPQARDMGISYARFTGGEPLLHNQILPLVSMGADAGLGMSIITNGFLLPRLLDSLQNAGLAQIIVSLDGSQAEFHDQVRGTRGLFRSAVKGLELAVQKGLRTRVNSVVGPHNYADMPALQTMLTDVGVEQWELSALKLDRPIQYNSPAHVIETCDPLYDRLETSRLIPMGKRFYGDTDEEREAFFSYGIPPRPSLPLCHLVGNAIYIDSKSGMAYGCSLLPHRPAKSHPIGVKVRSDGIWRLNESRLAKHVEYFRRNGASICTGCSTTAAGYSDQVMNGWDLPEWGF